MSFLEKKLMLKKKNIFITGIGKGIGKEVCEACLDNGARSRLSSVALVKPERARMIENQIIQMVRSGRVQGQLGEETIVGMLKQISSAQEKKAAVKISFAHRRTGWSDDDSDDNDDDLL